MRNSTAYKLYTKYVVNAILTFLFTLIRKSRTIKTRAIKMYLFVLFFFNETTTIAVVNLRPELKRTKNNNLEFNNKERKIQTNLVYTTHSSCHLD